MNKLLISLIKTAVSNNNLKVNITVDGDIEKVTRDICFQTLVKIHDILDSDLSDFECVEEIVVALEDINWGGGARHDF